MADNKIIFFLASGVPCGIQLSQRLNLGFRLTSASARLRTAGFSF